MCAKPHVADALTKMKVEKLEHLLREKGYDIEPNPEKLGGKKLVALRMRQIMKHMEATVLRDGGCADDDASGSGGAATDDNVEHDSGSPTDTEPEAAPGACSFQPSHPPLVRHSPPHPLLGDAPTSEATRLLEAFQQAAAEQQAQRGEASSAAAGAAPLLSLHTYSPHIILLLDSALHIPPLHCSPCSHT
jgi:hypothetical protein